MGVRSTLVLVVALAGCEKKQPRLEGPIEITLGDCAPTTVSWVSGPRPTPFDPATVGAERTAAIAGAKDEDPDAGGESSAGIASLTGTAVGADDDVWGGLTGDAVGELQGGFGYPAPSRPGGGGTGWGTIGTGRYGKIGHGSGTSGYGVGGGRGGLRGRIRPAPSVSVGLPTSQGDLDKAIIRRYMKRNLPKIQYCYEKQLLVTPTLGGVIGISFFISPQGIVSTAEAKGVDPAVSKCVANVIKRIEFPRPQNGAGVQVHYPITFRTADGKPGNPGPGADVPQPADGNQPAVGIVTATGGTGSGSARPDDPKPAAKPPATSDRSYRAGATSPLQALRDPLLECFRRQTKRYGVAVIDLVGGELLARGIENAEWKSCVAGLKKRLPEASKLPLACSIAFGPMAVADVPGVEISPTGVTFLGTKVAELTNLSADGKTSKIDALFDAATTRSAAIAAGKEPVALVGPLVMRPHPSTEMDVVNAVLMTVRASGEDPVLATQRDDGWQLLRDISLPVVPVPIGTGGSWNFDTRASGLRGAFDDERVKLSIAVTSTEIWVGVSRVNEFQHLPGHDLDKLATVLAAHKKALFADRADLEIAGDGKLPYSKLVEAITVVTRAGFTAWSLRDPLSLSARPQL